MKSFTTFTSIFSYAHTRCNASSPPQTVYLCHTESAHQRSTCQWLYRYQTIRFEVNVRAFERFSIEPICFCDAVRFTVWPLDGRCTLLMWIKGSEVVWTIFKYHQRTEIVYCAILFFHGNVPHSLFSSFFFAAVFLLCFQMRLFMKLSAWDILRTIITATVNLQPVE